MTLKLTQEQYALTTATTKRIFGERWTVQE